MKYERSRNWFQTYPRDSSVLEINVVLGRCLVAGLSHEDLFHRSCGVLRSCQQPASTGLQEASQLPSGCISS